MLICRRRRAQGGLRSRGPGPPLLRLSRRGAACDGDGNGRRPPLPLPVRPHVVNCVPAYPPFLLIDDVAHGWREVAVYLRSHSAVSLNGAPDHRIREAPSGSAHETGDDRDGLSPIVGSSAFSFVVAPDCGRFSVHRYPRSSSSTFAAHQAIRPFL